MFNDLFHLSQIKLSPETTWSLYNYITYIWKITLQIYGAKDRWYNGAQNKHQKQSKRWNRVCRVCEPTKRSIAQSLQENTIIVFGPRLYTSFPKYLRDIESLKTAKFKFELDKFLKLITDEPKMPNYVTAARNKSIHGSAIPSEGSRNLQPRRSLDSVDLSASKPLQVFQASLFHTYELFYCM